MITATLKKQEQSAKLEERTHPAQRRSASTVEGNSLPNSLVYATDTDEVFGLAIPRRGHVLSTVVEIYAKPVREAIAILSGSFAKTHCSEVRSSLLLPRTDWPQPGCARSNGEMAARAIVSVWLVGVAVKAFSPTASLAEAEEWFFGCHASERLTRLPSRGAINKAETALRSKADASAYFQLLPYILDPHGPGTRLSVKRDPATQSARKRKRAEGVFYTPADIAAYMAGACLSAISSLRLPTVFDLACGTGVYLRAALHEIKCRYPEKNTLLLATECLFGVDIDPWALDATAFVLLADSWGELSGKGTLPVEAWRRLRMNLACIDTLHIDPAETIFPDNTTSLSRKGADRFPISRLFPALNRGPTVILGNPPYADIGRRPDLVDLGRVYETLAIKPQPNAEIYLPFIEQMIRLGDREMCSGALVLPLSVACNVGPQFSKTREIISKTRGRWRFAFFDREPHALFGEDVKTRNTIILWSRTPSETKPVLYTGPLRKWRGDTRAAMFCSLKFTLINGPIRAGIPKIEGESQAKALRALGLRWSRLDQVVQSIERINLAQTPNSDDRTVFVGPTAYNFLNVFLRPPQDLLHSKYELSEHPLFAVKCASKRDALAVFAILSSHLAYWWWHTHGDGFHVSRRFVAELPFGIEELTEEVTGLLSKHGAELWSLIKANPIISLNRGRTSLAYTPNGYDDIRRNIDQVLADIAGLEDAFIDELQQFTTRTVAATLREHAITETDERDTV